MDSIWVEGTAIAPVELRGLQQLNRTDMFNLEFIINTPFVWADLEVTGRLSISNWNFSEPLILPLTRKAYLISVQFCDATANVSFPNLLSPVSMMNVIIGPNALATVIDIGSQAGGGPTSALVSIIGTLSNPIVEIRGLSQVAAGYLELESIAIARAWPYVAQFKQLFVRRTLYSGVMALPDVTSPDNIDVSDNPMLTELHLTNLSEDPIFSLTVSSNALLRVVDLGFSHGGPLVVSYLIIRGLCS